jgi:hypothetical protein
MSQHTCNAVDPTSVEECPGCAQENVSDAQLQAAFLAARQLGRILTDEVLRAIILAAREVRP